MAQSADLESLAFWSIRLVEASHDFRNHCCEFSKFSVTHLPDDQWPDVADQLLELLGNVEHIARTCESLGNAYRAQLVKTVAELKLPRPNSHLSWTLWTVEHWRRVAWKAKLRIRQVVDLNPEEGSDWFCVMAAAARQQPEKCKALSQKIISISELFQDFDDQAAIKERVRLECIGLDALKPPMPARDCPITWSALYELCVNKMNRVGKELASSKHTVRGWQYARGWPKPMTWNTVRHWLNTYKDYDIGEPPTEC